MKDTQADAATGPAGSELRVLDYRQNPFGLVYEYAITKNEPGKVNIHSVTYTLHGLEIAANVYTPANYDPAGKFPAITVAHPNGGVKEQTAGRYAQRLAEEGYITIAADAAYQGASGGEPRNVDKPFYRIEDIHGMADFITHYPGVDVARLGLLGICGGGGYSLSAAKTDKRFKAVATVSMFNSGRVRRNGYADSQLDTIQQRLQQASDARAKEVTGGGITHRTHEMTGGNVLYAGDANLTDEEIAKLPFDLYRQGYHYYWRTHAHPGSTFKYTMSSLLDLMRWDATDQIELIDQPLLMIAGSKADSLYMTEDAFPKATGTKDKELFKIEGATHIETYWVDEYVDAALGKLTAFFARTIQHPNAPGKYVFSSLGLQIAFYAFAAAETISPRPLLMIVGSKADTLYFSREAVEKAKQPKELFVVEGATHSDMYDQPQFVSQAVAKLTGFYAKHL